MEGEQQQTARTTADSAKEGRLIIGAEKTRKRRTRLKEILANHYPSSKKEIIKK